MRFHVEMVRDEEGRIAGEVRSDGEAPSTFSGWLELLRLLEDRAELIHERGGPAPLSGDDLEERL